MASNAAVTRFDCAYPASASQSQADVISGSVPFAGACGDSSPAIPSSKTSLKTSLPAVAEPYGSIYDIIFDESVSGPAVPANSNLACRPLFPSIAGKSAMDLDYGKSASGMIVNAPRYKAMPKSASPRHVDGIHKAMSEIMARICVARNSEIKFGNTKYKYRSLYDLQLAVGKAFAKHGITIESEIVGQPQLLPSADGKTLTAMFVVRYKFTHPDGSCMYASAVGQGLDNGDKGANKAMSAAFKYAISQMLCLADESLVDQDAERMRTDGTVEARREEEATGDNGQGGSVKKPAAGDNAAMKRGPTKEEFKAHELTQSVSKPVKRPAEPQLMEYLAKEAKGKKQSQEWLANRIIIYFGRVYFQGKNVAYVKRWLIKQLAFEDMESFIDGVNADDCVGLELQIIRGEKNV